MGLILTLSIPVGASVGRLVNEVIAAVNAVGPEVVIKSANHTDPLEFFGDRALTSPEVAAGTAARDAHDPDDPPEYERGDLLWDPVAADWKVRKNGSPAEDLPSGGGPPDPHTHVPTDVTGTAVITSDSRLSDARTPTAHAHLVADTTGLQAALDGKAAASHVHALGDTTGLVAALAGKSDVGHTHPGGGGVELVQTTLSFGAIPTRSAVFVIAHVGALPTMAVLVSRREPTLDTDENAGGWDRLEITARAETDQVRILVESPHRVRGDFPITYLAA